MPEKSEKTIANDLTFNSIQDFRQKSPNFEKEMKEKIVSKLDLEEIKLKQKRVNKCLENGFSSNEESDQSDSSESDDYRSNRYNIILTKRLPLKLDTNSHKMKFLEVFNLTSHKRKSQLELNKYMKRRKILRQQSPQPQESDPIEAIEEKIEENKDNPKV